MTSADCWGISPAGRDPMEAAGGGIVAPAAAAAFAVAAAAVAGGVAAAASSVSTSPHGVPERLVSR